jgi:hypothetical protein
MMLDFYGMKIENKSSQLPLKDKEIIIKDSQFYFERFENLLKYTHNFYRITRILNCLALLGLENYQYGFLDHLVTLASPKGKFKKIKRNNGSKKALIQYWIPTLENRNEELMNKLIKKHRDLNSN